jgi:ribosomal protein S18 acetylase RimI-like enzyme
LYQIKKALITDAKVLSKLSVATFLPAHGHSAPKKDIDAYINQSFSEENFFKELSDATHQYYIIYVDNYIAGYSKIIFNQTQRKITAKNITYMSRLYLLKEFYGLGLGKYLFDFNIKLCKENKQSGIWLAVWVENQKGISFYKKMGFKKVGDFDFKISKTHSNPNHILYLEF